MIQSLDGKLELANGVEMPGFGYGCYLASGKELTDALATAIEYGYRQIDTAAFYKNEEEVGQTLKKSSVPREKLFIVSKIWPVDFEEPVKALDKSLKALGLDWLDGYLLHWPGLNELARFHAWEKLYSEMEKGKIRALGVSNFMEKHLEQLHEKFNHWPLINQIEVHPAFQEFGLCNFCMKRKIQIVSWSPLGRGRVLEQPQLIEIGKHYGKTPAQVALRWQIQMDYIPLPKSVHSERVRENANIFDFSLSKSEMEIIRELNLPNDAGRIGKDPDKFPEV